MRDVNGSSFALLTGPGDRTVAKGMMWNGSAYMLAGKQNWLLPSPPMARAAAQSALTASKPTVIDAYGGVASIAPDGMSIRSPEGSGTLPLADLNGVPLAPKVGRFVDMALGGGRLALLASDGTSGFLELFDLRGRWGLDTPENPALPLTQDPTGSGVAVADDGKIYVLVSGGVAVYEGGPINEFVSFTHATFAPVAANPNPLRQTALIGNRPGGTPLAMAVDASRLAILLDHGTAPQTLAICDRASGTWTTAPATATDGTPLPYMTDVALLDDAQIALMAPATKAGPLDCAVVTLTPPSAVAMAPYRYPMLSQAAPRFAAVPGPEVYYLALTGPRRLLPLPYPAYSTAGALASVGIAGGDPDGVWHRLYAEAYLPPGTSLTAWARAAEQPITLGDAAAVLATIQNAPLGTTRIDLATAAAIAAAQPTQVPPLTATLRTRLTDAPFHLQPPLAKGDLASELPFHPGLAALTGMPGALYEVLLQRTGGANRRLTGR